MLPLLQSIGWKAITCQFLFGAMCGVSTPWESQSMVPTSPGRQTTLTVNTLGPGTYLSNLNPNIFFLSVSKQNMFVFLFVLLLRVSKPSFNLSYTSIWDHWNVSTTTLNDKYTPLNKDHVRLQRTPLNTTKKNKKKCHLVSINGALKRSHSTGD